MDDLNIVKIFIFRPAENCNRAEILKMKYFGLKKQVIRNNTAVVTMLFLFLLFSSGVAWMVIYFLSRMTEPVGGLSRANSLFLTVEPVLITALLLWFLVALAIHISLIVAATGSRPLSRRENKRIFGLVENLCISSGIKMPAIMVIDDDSLNSFSAGFGEKRFFIALSRGMLDKLNDDELDTVIAHELTHVRNRDARLLAVSIVFVGIFGYISESIIRSLKGDTKGSSAFLSWISSPFLVLFIPLRVLFDPIRLLALSDERELLADAGSVELTRRPQALVSALKKISADPAVKTVSRRDVVPMFIEDPGLPGTISQSTVTVLSGRHPLCSKRIELLENY